MSLCDCATPRKIVSRVSTRRIRVSSPGLGVDSPASTPSLAQLCTCHCLSLCAGHRLSLCAVTVCSPVHVSLTAGSSSSSWSLSQLFSPSRRWLLFFLSAVSISVSLFDNGSCVLGVHDTAVCTLLSLPRDHHSLSRCSLASCSDLSSPPNSGHRTARALAFGSLFHS